MKKVIYTVITGQYDKLNELTEKNPEWDYVCLTDDPDNMYSETWDIQGINTRNGSSPLKLSRFPKAMPFNFFPRYGIAVYVDANLRLTADIQTLIDRYPESDIIVSKHPYRSCLYNEEATVIRTKRDYEENTKPQMQRYKKEGFPAGFGLSHCNVIVYRNTIATSRFCAKWWIEIDAHSHRDQLSFDYVRWAMGDDINITRISNSEKRKYVKKTKHTKEKQYPPQIETQGIDVVYPLRKSKSWGDNELRFSIRSVIKHFKDLRNIVIIGERKPDWLKNAIFIKVNDDMDYKDANLIKKLLAACTDKYISNQFLWGADDKFLCEDIDFKELSGWHFGEIEHENPIEWQQWVLNTKKELYRRELPAYDYNYAHAFQPVDKSEFLQIIDKWNWKRNQYTDMNIYHNSTKIFKGIDCRDFHTKFRSEHDRAAIMRRLHNAVSFNINAEALNDAMRQTLQELYPDKSKYEIVGFGNDPYSEYLEWCENKNFWEGVQLIKQHTRNYHLMRFFDKKGKSARTQKILEKNLKLISRKWKK